MQTPNNLFMPPKFMVGMVFDAASDAAAAAATAASEAAAKVAADAATAAAAEKAASDKIISDKAAADKAAADKVISDKAAAEAAKAAAAEAARIAASGTDAEKLAAEKAALLGEVMDKKQKLADQQKLLDAYKGADPAKVAAMIAAEKTAEEAALIASGEFEAAKEMMAGQHALDTASKDAEILALQTQREKDATQIDDLTVGAAFDSSKFITEELIFSSSKARALWGSHVGMKDGTVVVFDKPASAKDRTPMADASGKSVSFEDGMKRLVEADPDKDQILKSKMKPGSKSKTVDLPGKPNKPGSDPSRGAARIMNSLNATGDLKA